MEHNSASEQEVVSICNTISQKFIFSQAHLHHSSPDTSEHQPRPPKSHALPSQTMLQHLRTNMELNFSH